MNKLLLGAVVLVSAACATARPDLDNEAIDDFIAVRQLEEVDSVRTDSTDGWTELNLNYVVYRTRRGEFLFEFARRCFELDERRVTPDTRWDSNVIRARFDTLRGCRIEKIFRLTEAEAEELRQLGEAPGSRN